MHAPLPLLASAESPTGGIAGVVVDLMEALGGPGAGLAIALENLFPPLPSEVVLPLAGFTASLGSFTLAEALFWTTLGSVVGALLLYTVGGAIGPDRTRSLACRLPLVREADLDRAQAWFARYGTAAVLLGRLVPVVRSLISVPAGVERMPIPLFLLLTAMGSFVWNAALIGAGYALGENWGLVEGYAGRFQQAVLVTAVALVGLFVATRVRRRLAPA